MDTSASPRTLYFLGIILLSYNLLTCVRSQGVGDVWFSLRNTTYQNNSCVALEDIGEGDDALLCVTNETDCCTRTGSLVNWFFFNGTRISSGGDFNTTRGHMVIGLNRRGGGVEGILYCDIPDSMNVTQTIYIGVYKTNTSTRAGDVWFSLRNKIYQNNSCVTLEDIGENDTALLCMTNLTARCIHNFTGTGSTLGNWFFPNGTRVLSSGDQWDFYRTGGQSVVKINRRRGGVEGIYRCEIPDSMNVTQTVRIGVYITVSTSEVATPTQTVGATTTTGTVPVSSSTTKTVGATATTGTVPVSSTTKTGETTATTGSVPVSSSTQPTNNSPSDGATTTSVIIVVAVVIILITVAGVVILVVFRAKKRKQKLEINKLQSVTKDIEMKLKQESIEKEDSSNQLPYAEIQTEAPPNVPSKSAQLMEFLNKNNHHTGGYSEIELEPADSKHALPSKPPRQVNCSDSMPIELESNTQDVGQHSGTTNVIQETNIYTVPDTTSSHTSGVYETVYSEPIQPSLFTDADGTSSSDSDNLQPYAPMYTVPKNLPKSDKVLLKVSSSNIREIRELGMGQFGKVILAETVGLSTKDLRMSESDDDKSKSTLVAMKKLKSDASNATKEAFEKEVNFMSRLTDRNVIRILGACYEDTPFIMMEYMEKGDLNQYLQRFKTLSTTDSEPQGQITTRTLVHMTTEIASAMKYLVSYNFVHRDLATRNCLVGPNYLVKISDFGMSRSLYDSHYYRIHGRFMLPVRWMAYECFYGKFSQKSDVWAFGVTMWEIFVLAKEQPYNDMSDKQVVDDALKGKNRKILAKPDMCPLKVYKIMIKCWEHNSDQRATFDELYQLLTSIHRNL